MIEKIFAASEEKMKKTVERIRSDFSIIRTGRASVNILDHIRVTYYGSLMPINQVATLTVSEARVIEIKPWDKMVMPEIEKAILKSDLGITPLNDGKIIRINFPPLSEERRKDLVRMIKKMAEDFRVAIRNERRDALENLKRAEKYKEISEDERFDGEQKLQKLTDNYMKKIDELLAIKEKEILEV